MAPVTATAPRNIELFAPAMLGGTIILGLDELAFNPAGGYRVVRHGPKIKFRQGRATIDAPTMKLLEHHPAWTGKGEPRKVWPLGHPDAPGIAPGEAGPQVVDGAYHSAVGQKANQPLSGYDEMNVPTLRKKLRSGDLSQGQLLDLVQYERATKNRATVISLAINILAGMEEIDPAAEVPDEVDAEVRAAIENAEAGDEPDIEGDVTESAPEEVL